jgi:hypothetical protein
MVRQASQRFLRLWVIQTAQGEAREHPAERSGSSSTRRDWSDLYSGSILDD